MPLLLADFIRQSLQTILRITLDTTSFSSSEVAEEYRLLTIAIQ